MRMNPNITTDNQPNPPDNPDQYSMKKSVTAIYGGYGGLCESNIKGQFRIILHTSRFFN